MLKDDGKHQPTSLRATDCCYDLAQVSQAGAATRLGRRDEWGQQRPELKMRKSTFTEDQIINILKGVEIGQRVADACRIALGHFTHFFRLNSVFATHPAALTRGWTCRVVRVVARRRGRRGRMHQATP